MIGYAPQCSTGTPSRCLFSLLLAVFFTLAGVLAYADIENSPPSSLPIHVPTADNIHIVINANIDKTELSLGSLRSIFSMRKRSWQNQTPIKVIVLPDDHPIHLAFCKMVLKVYPFVLREQWDSQVFNGTGLTTITAKSPQHLQELVAQIPGAIGYIRATSSTNPEASSTHTGDHE